MFEPFGSYTLKMARSDSDRAKAEYIDRFIIKLRKANDAYFGVPMKCLIAACAVTVLSFNGLT